MKIWVNIRLKLRQLGVKIKERSELRDQILESLFPAPNGSSLLFTKLHMREGFITSSKKTEQARTRTASR